MLFPDRIYIAWGPGHLGVFATSFWQIKVKTKKVLIAERGALALRHMANTAQVIALR